MIEHRSPWLHQLKRTRPAVALGSHCETGLAIVGGGIAGVITAYYALRDTTETVLMLEGDRVAHGATGHNAGQITSYFERPLSELAREFGPELAADGQHAVESAWVLLDEIISEAKLKTPAYRFTGYAGLSQYEQVLVRLRDNQIRRDGDLPLEGLVIAEEWPELVAIPLEFEGLYTVAPHKDIMALLEVKNPDYIAALSYQKGCMNSALFSEEVAGYLLQTYPDRFSLFEHSKVDSVRLTAAHAALAVGTHEVIAKRVVLATNGFENFHIINESGSPIDTAFHHMVAGRIGYMAGYVQPISNPPVAISYFPKADLTRADPTGESYFYLTRRPHDQDGDTAYNLVCVGGPDTPLPNQALYVPGEVSLEHVTPLIDEFLRANYQAYPDSEVEYAFCWSGLMGYTPSGVRLVGPEPRNPRLMYNLGCNGVGILPSIWGGKRISQYLLGGEVEPSMFDPRERTGA